MNKSGHISTSELAKRGGYYERTGPAANASAFKLWLSAILTRKCAARSIYQASSGSGVLAKGDQRTPRVTNCARQHASGCAQSAEAKIADIEGKVEHLREMKKALVRLTEACCENGPTSDCPLLKA